MARRAHGLIRALAVLAGAGLATAPDATAHGPCGCIQPTLAEPGAGVTVRSPAYRVLLNPRPAQLGIAPDHLGGAHRPDAPTVSVIDRSARAPRRRLRFRVPPVPPGVYMVLIFDGDEGGAHNTWDYLHVLGEARRPARRRERRDEPGLGRLLAGIAIGAVAGLAWRRRRV